MRDQSFETQNINIEKTYGGQESSSIIHYETFDNLALFYGRKSLVHFHDRFYQVHYLTEGSIALQLDAHEYRLYAPCFYYSAFYSSWLLHRFRYAWARFNHSTRVCLAVIRIVKTRYQLFLSHVY